VGYNPINGESYSTKDGLNSKVEQVETTENEKESDGVVKTPEEENVEQVENGNEKPAENGNAQTPTDTTENGTSPAPVDKPTNGHANGTNGHSTAKVR
jgi:TolA-binding protein